MRDASYAFLFLLPAFAISELHMRREATPMKIGSMHFDLCEFIDTVYLMNTCIVVRGCVCVFSVGEVHCLQLLPSSCSMAHHQQQGAGQQGVYEDLTLTRSTDGGEGAYANLSDLHVLDRFSYSGDFDDPSSLLDRHPFPPEFVPG